MVSDPQNPGDTLTSVIGVYRGTIQVSGAGSFIGNGTGSVTMVGTADQINALLQRTSY